MKISPSEHENAPPELSGAYSAAAVGRLVTSVGGEVLALSEMLVKPTEVRPFVYEMRFDLYPARDIGALAILKGFGQDGPLIAFHEGSGLVGLLTGVHDRLLAGKLRFKEDEYAAKNYEERFKKLRSEDEYKATKLPSYQRLFGNEE